MSIKYTKIILLMYFLSLFAVGCVSLLPPERRVYPKNPIQLSENLNIEEWLNAKAENSPKRFWWKQIDESQFKFTYIRKELNPNGSHIACSALIRNKSTNNLELYNLIFTVNYADYTKNFIGKRGDLGPLNEKERIEILIPCIEEFLSYIDDIHLKLSKQDFID